MYVLCIKGEWGAYDKESNIWKADTTPTGNHEFLVIIGNGDYDSNGDYRLGGDTINFSLSTTPNKNGEFNKYYFIRPSINIDNPYFCLQLSKNKYFNFINPPYISNESFFFFKILTKTNIPKILIIITAITIKGENALFKELVSLLLSLLSLINSPLLFLDKSISKYIPKSDTLFLFTDQVYVLVTESTLCALFETTL